MTTISTLAESLKDYDVLVLPGWRNSGPAHWQTRWELLFPRFRRVQQQNWMRPRVCDWVQALEQAVSITTRPVILIAHSLGCVTVAHWAAQFDTTKIAGALLVAPADVERSTIFPGLRNFGPLPLRPLPFHALLVGSDNDPCCAAWRAAQLAENWGAAFRVLSGAGHINADSGLGDWPEGLGLLQTLLPTGGPIMDGVPPARKWIHWAA